MKSNLNLLVRAFAALAIATVASTPLFAQSSDHPDAVATARLKPAENLKVTGVVHFVPVSGGMRVVAHVINLSPGKHGFHVHEKGDLSASDFSSAGGHFNPAGQPHGGPQDTRRHIGDLGNLEANSRGVATLDYVDAHLAIEGENSIIGRAVIVHEKADDLKSQPSGDAGARIAGGVIERVRPKAATSQTK